MFGSLIPHLVGSRGLLVAISLLLMLPLVLGGIVLAIVGIVEVNHRKDLYHISGLRRVFREPPVGPQWLRISTGVLKSGPTSRTGSISVRNADRRV